MRGIFNLILFAGNSKCTKIYVRKSYLNQLGDIHTGNEKRTMHKILIASKSSQRHLRETVVKVQINDEK